MFSFPFHLATKAWFTSRFNEPTEPQRLGWQSIVKAHHTLIAAPTGSGKTLAAFLVGIDLLVQAGAAGALENETMVLYVSPLKALSNDIHRNLEIPLGGIQDEAARLGIGLSPIRALVRTGDTPAGERASMARKPPHILVTTPESLYLLLTSDSGRRMLKGVRMVIVDEIHALAKDKRGSHLALSLERLTHLAGRDPVRVGLSATQRPMDEIARFLVGAANVDPAGRPACTMIDVGHARTLDLAIEVPPAELSAVCSQETWAQIHARLAELISNHKSTLIFVNTRRLAERLTFHLSALLGADRVASHHGSLSRNIRISAEERLAAGELKAIVATASLELGIDVGYIDLVCQISSPRSIAAFLQRVGRSGHALGLVPKGRLFPLTRDELLECLALVRSVRAGRLDRIEVPSCALDALAQQIVAAVCCEEWSEDELFTVVRRAWPFRGLERALFESIVRMLSEGVDGSRRSAYLHRDAIHGKIRARRGARLAALSNGGMIPETGDYRVILALDRTFVGTVNEDFAIESMAGDIFLLGNRSWRIRQVTAGEVLVDDAEAAPPSIPFWLGEAPGRTVELSAELSDLRTEIARRLPDHDWIVDECGASSWAAEQAGRYVHAQQAALGRVPSRTQVVFERFFDEAGGMQLVIHAPFGSRINRAWGLALRKRFCRSFDFELQAAATDNGIVLSLGPQHSFSIDLLFGMLNRQNGAHLLIQALLAVPMFRIRWRWNATRALAVLRQQAGRRVPAPLQRFRSDDLLSAVFPAQTACQENQTGDIEVPDHPLIRQTVHDCLHEAMDVDGWLDLLDRIEAGTVELVPADTREPSPFSYEILNANPYAFLDGAPLEERRARAVATRRSLSVEELTDLALLDPEAIQQVRREAWPLVRDADELHDALLLLAAVPAGTCDNWLAWFEELVRHGRAALWHSPNGRRYWTAAELAWTIGAALPGAVCHPPLTESSRPTQPIDPAEGVRLAVRGWMEVSGPQTDLSLAERLGFPAADVRIALGSLECEGVVLAGKFTPAGEGEWCDRRLLARIHSLTLSGARRRVEPVDAAVFWRFLLDHQHLTPATRLGGTAGLAQILRQLQGIEAPLGAWEDEIFPLRLEPYDPDLLDEACLDGTIAWGRLSPPRRLEQWTAASDADSNGLSRSAVIHRAVPASLVHRQDLVWLLPADRAQPVTGLSGAEGDVYQALVAHGALFVQDLAAATGLLPAQVEDSLAMLAALGLVASDGFRGVRRAVDPHRRHTHRLRRRPTRSRALAPGRWSRFPGPLASIKPEVRVERWALQLIERWGVVFKDLLAQESLAPPWWQLRGVYRRMEARGELRGGLFVRGVSGEQYASPEAVDRLRRFRDLPLETQPTVLSAADPLNLTGILDSGPRLPTSMSNALGLLNGRVVGRRLAADVASEGGEDLVRLLRMSAAARRFRDVPVSVG